MGQHRPDQGEHHPAEGDAEDQDIEWGLSRVPGRAVHHHCQPAVRQQGKQDVQDVLWRQMEVVEDPRHDPRFGVERSGTGEVQRNLSVQGRLGLQDPQEHFGEPLQRIGAAMR
ncbi:hypothetical protein GCM10008957_20410 [Deinococcus ruber]|uniref:Uncharacterized protein n=1 Tax=Deinococcus ruber TaxID=1848197 RepID=A0A918C5J1_9DEIO|nr:hypothetical protein GCM10008957_20410 [Deinococcus ruber]